MELDKQDSPPHPPSAPLAQPTLQRSRSARGHSVPHAHGWPFMHVSCLLALPDRSAKTSCRRSQWTPCAWAVAALAAARWRRRRRRKTQLTCHELHELHSGTLEGRGAAWRGAGGPAVWQRLRRCPPPRLLLLRRRRRRRRSGQRSGMGWMQPASVVCRITSGQLARFAQDRRQLRQSTPIASNVGSTIATSAIVTGRHVLAAASFPRRLAPPPLPPRSVKDLFSVPCRSHCDGSFGSVSAPAVTTWIRCPAAAALTRAPACRCCRRCRQPFRRLALQTPLRGPATRLTRRASLTCACRMEPLVVRSCVNTCQVPPAQPAAAHWIGHAPRCRHGLCKGRRREEPPLCVGAMSGGEEDAENKRRYLRWSGE